MKKFKKVKPNEWQMPVMKNYKMACCDCGLVHNMTFKVINNYTQKKIKSGRLLMKATRDNKLTKELRNQTDNMNTVLKLLIKELKEWKAQHADSKIFFKGEELDKEAKKCFKNEIKHINELSVAIAILNECK